MGERVKITLTNNEVTDRRLGIAISKLAGQSFAYKLAWAITDVQDAVEKQTKKYQNTLKNLFKTHGAKTDNKGNYFFDNETGDAEKDAGKVFMPAACREEIEALGEETMEHELELIELPLTRKVKDKDGKEKDEPIEYEPIIFIGMKKFIKR